MNYTQEIAEIRKELDKYFSYKVVIDCKKMPERGKLPSVSQILLLLELAEKYIKQEAEA